MQNKKSVPYLSRMFLPVIVDAPGNYVTRSGEVVTITAVKKASYGLTCKGVYPQGILETWTKSGHIFPSIESGNDIVAKAA